MKTPLVIGCLLLVSGSAILAEPAAARLTIDPNGSQVEFRLDTTWHTVEGRTRAVTGAITSESGDLFKDGRVSVTIQADQLVTGNSSRDAKMRNDCLETGRYPMITFVSSDAPSTVSSHSDPNGGYSEVSLRIPGDLTIHGVKRNVELTAVLKRDGDAWVVTGALPVKLSEYSVPNPSILFNKVKDDLTVTFSVRAR